MHLGKILPLLGLGALGLATGGFGIPAALGLGGAASGGAAAAGGIETALAPLTLGGVAPAAALPAVSAALPAATLAPTGLAAVPGMLAHVARLGSSANAALGGGDAQAPQPMIGGRRLSEAQAPSGLLAPSPVSSVGLPSQGNSLAMLPALIAALGQR